MRPAAFKKLVHTSSWAAAQLLALHGGPVDSGSGSIASGRPQDLSAQRRRRLAPARPAAPSSGPKSSASRPRR